jgi:hypothetical protein
MVFNATFNNFFSFIGWSVLFGREEYLVKTTDLPQLDHIIMYTSPLVGFELITLEMIGTGCYA